MARFARRGIAPRQRRRQRWPIVGLLLALALLGHDLLTTADAHAAAAPAAARPATGAPTAATSDHDGGPPDGPVRPEPGCEAGLASAPRPDAGERVEATPASAVGAHAPSSSPAPPIAAAPPTTAPSVRRALTQAFLI